MLIVPWVSSEGAHRYDDEGTSKEILVDGGYVYYFRNLGNATWGEFFGGLIDNVRIYSRALSPAAFSAFACLIWPKPRISAGTEASALVPK